MMSKAMGLLMAMGLQGNGGGWGGNSWGKGGDSSWGKGGDRSWGKGGKGQKKNDERAHDSTRPKAASDSTGEKNVFIRDKPGNEELGECTGKVKSFKSKQNYGFITTEEHGDVFCHADEMLQFKKGMTVKFDLVMTAEGKHNAIKLRSGLK